MKDDLYTQNPPLFIALENTKKCKKIFFSCSLLPFTDLLVRSSHKGTIYEGETRSPWEFYVRRSLISLLYLNLALLKGVLTAVSLGLSDFMASQ